MKLISTLLLVPTIVVTALAQPPPIDFQHIRDLCSKIEVTEDLFLEGRSSSEAPTQLTALVRDHWSLLFESFQTEIPDPYQQTVIAVAVSSMNGEEYLRAVAHGLRLYCDGRISLQAAHQLLMPPMNRYGFLAVNRNHPLVRELLPELKRKMPPGDRDTEFVAMLIDGRAEKQALEYWRRYNEPAITPLGIVKSNTSNGVSPRSTSPARLASKPPNESAVSVLDTSQGVRSSTPWSIIVVLIAAAIGLLWLLLKRRS
jgi:hypothetical protein